MMADSSNKERFCVKQLVLLIRHFFTSNEQRSRYFISWKIKIKIGKANCQIHNTVYFLQQYSVFVELSTMYEYLSKFSLTTFDSGTCYCAM
jgi:hypothetical protein